MTTTQPITAATIQDVRDALVLKYGPSRIHEVSRSSKRVRYFVETHSKRHLNCHIRLGNGALILKVSPWFAWSSAITVMVALALFVPPGLVVALSLSPRFRWSSPVTVLICLALFSLPGVVAGLWAGVNYIGTLRRVPRYTEDIVRLVEYQVKKRISQTFARLDAALKD